MISVIIPVYNNASSFGRALDSVLGQEEGDLQVIIVDDGSTDESPQLIDEAAEKDARITVIHQPNGGPGSARNAGLDIAKGEWVAFVDADDYVRPDYFGLMLEAAEETDADLVISDSLMCGPKGDKPFGFIRPNCIYRDRGALWVDFVASHISWSLWGRIYRAELWEDIRFRPEDYIAEDLDANSRIFAKEGVVVATVPSTGYHYTLGEGTVDTTFTARHIQQYQVFEEVCERALDLDLNPWVWYEERALNCLKKAIAADAFIEEAVLAVQRHRGDALTNRFCDRGLKLRMALACGGPLGRKLLMHV